MRQIRRKAIFLYCVKMIEVRIRVGRSPADRSPSSSSRNTTPSWTWRVLTCCPRAVPAFSLGGGRHQRRRRRRRRGWPFGGGVSVAVRGTRWTRSYSRCRLRSADASETVIIATVCEKKVRAFSRNRLYFHIDSSPNTFDRSSRPHEKIPPPYIYIYIYN